MAEQTLVALEKYLKTGSHIGTRFKTGDMHRYIFKVRKDGLKVLDVETIDKRIRTAAEFLAGFDAHKILVVSRKVYGHAAVKKFAEATGARVLTGRFMPGTLTNPKAKAFIECSAIIVTDPDYDKQAIQEAVKTRIPVVALASTNNYLENIDIVVPINNKGRKSIALAYWLIAREFLKLKEIIKKDEDFTMKEEEFEYQLKEGEEERMMQEERPQRGKKNLAKQRRRGGNDRRPGGGRGRRERPERDNE